MSKHLDAVRLQNTKAEGGGVPKKVVKPVMVSPALAGMMFSTSPGTLGNLRSQRKGPKFYKVGHKVLYSMADLEEYFCANPVVTLDSLGQE
jgi:hypothetical protein